MSVINKMLRDLDARQSAATGRSRDAGIRLMQGTAGVPGQVAARSPVRALRWLVGLLVLLAAAAAAWYLHDGASPSGNRPQPVVAVVATPAPALEPAVSVPIVTATTRVQADSAPVSPPAPEPTVTARPPVAAPKARLQAAASGPQQPQTATVRAEPKKAPVREKPLRLERSQPALQSASETTVVAAASPVRTPAERVALAPTPAPGSTADRASVPPSPQLQRQAAAQETLAHAQGLWAAGSREAALDLMREAVAVAERAQQAGTLAMDSPVLASLVRELVRMELAQGRVSRVLELLTRLEPALAGQADLWAVRGNAAQRLARHQESVQAYLRALELRPDEPRWMLGAAVSLAALGRLEAAAEQAETARAAGIVSPEILTYLRQAGVPLK